jgi:hypothetical protein
MTQPITLRVCASPLLPQHLVAALAPLDGMGFAADDMPTMGRGYHEIVLQACNDQIAGDAAFNQAIAGKFYAPIQRPIAKLDARNQFLALAPAIDICGMDDKAQMILDHLLSGPFVLTMRTLATFERARRSMAGNPLSESKLMGFLEQHIGCSAALFTVQSPTFKLRMPSEAA